MRSAGQEICYFSLQGKEREVFIFIFFLFNIWWSLLKCPKVAGLFRSWMKLFFGVGLPTHPPVCRRRRRLLFNMYRRETPFFFFGRKTNLLFLCWLWENVLVFLPCGKKRKKRRRHWGINFLFPNHENGASAVVSDFSMSWRCTQTGCHAP